MLVAGLLSPMLGREVEATVGPQMHQWRSPFVRRLGTKGIERQDIHLVSPVTSCKLTSRAMKQKITSCVTSAGLRLSCAEPADKPPKTAAVEHCNKKPDRMANTTVGLLSAWG